MHSYAVCKQKADYFCSCQKSQDGNKMCMYMSFLHLWIVQNVHCLCSKQYFRDPRCLTDLVRCCVIVDSIQVSSPLFQFSLGLNFLPVQAFDMSRLVALCLCDCLCFCMCVCTSVSVHSLTAKLAGCLHMPWRNIFAGCNRDRKQRHTDGKHTVTFGRWK